MLVKCIHLANALIAAIINQVNYTNKTNLPDAIIQAIKNDDYTKGKSDISITGLTVPARKRVLLKKYDSQITVDYADKINILLGQVMHGILERANVSALAEERFYLEIEGITISGEMDAVYESTGLLQDYKFTSLYQVKNGKVSPDYEAQLNCYAYLLKYGYRLEATEGFDEFKKIFGNYTITKMQDVFIFRDWTKGKAKRDALVPQYQCVIIDVDMWGDEKTLAYLKSRIAAHKAANKKLPECTPEERWAAPDQWAVMAKPGAPRSIKNHLSKDEAELHLMNALTKNPNAIIEYRPGFSNRCDGGYCEAASVCSQYKELKHQMNLSKIDNNEE